MPLLALCGSGHFWLERNGAQGLKGEARLPLAHVLHQQRERAVCFFFKAKTALDSGVCQYVPNQYSMLVLWI